MDTCNNILSALLRRFNVVKLPSTALEGPALKAPALKGLALKGPTKIDQNVMVSFCRCSLLEQDA